MTWLQPWAIWFLAGLPVIVLLYLLKVRRVSATVSTLIFWQRVVLENRRRALFQRLRSLFSLLLHLLIFALIVAALARPAFDRLIRDGASTVIIVDVRARMQAIEPDGEARFAKAIAGTLATIRDASSGRQFALLTAGANSTVVQPFSGDERALRLKTVQLKATDAGGSLEPALELAESLLATRQGPRQIIVFTDRPLPASVAARHSSVVVRAVGSPQNNAAVIRFAARPLPASPATSEIFLELRNFGETNFKGNLELRFDDRLLDVKTIAMEAGGAETLLFPSVPRPGPGAQGHLVATLSPGDALRVDDTARVWLPPPRSVRVLLITPGNVFLEKALSADPGVSYELLSPDSWNDSLATKFDVVVFDGELPDTVPPVNAFYLRRTPFDAPTAPTLDRPVLTEIDTTHPTLRHVELSQTTILQARPLALPAPSPEWAYAAPLRSFDHAILVAGEHRGKGTRIAALGIDLTATDLPLRVAFPLLVTNTIHWLAGAVVDAPVPLRAGEGQHVENGFYPATRDGRTEWVAVNTFDENESNLAFAIDPAPSTTSPEITMKPFLAWPLWRYLALGALALFTLEWILFHQRRTE